MLNRYKVELCSENGTYTFYTNELETAEKIIKLFQLNELSEWTECYISQLDGAAFPEKYIIIRAFQNEPVNSN